MLRRSRRAVGFIEPCLPSPAKAPPTGPDWLNEIKHDGFRIMAVRDDTGVRLFALNEHYVGDGDIVYQQAGKLGCEGIVSMRLGSTDRSGCSRHWVKIKNPVAPAMRREAEEGLEALTTAGATGCV